MTVVAINDNTIRVHDFSILHGPCSKDFTNTSVKLKPETLRGLLVAMLQNWDDRHSLHLSGSEIQPGCVMHIPRY